MTKRALKLKRIGATMYGRDRRLDWQGITLAATKGSHLGAILRAAYGKNEEHIVPSFGAHATVTSDGFLLADFTARNGEHHMGAFVGSLRDLQQNVTRLAVHCELIPEDMGELGAAVARWHGARV